MKKLFLLAVSNIRGEKGQTVSFLVIMTIAILLFNTGIITLFNFGASFNQDAERLNSEKVSLLTVSSDANDDIIATVEKIDGVTETETDEVVCGNVSFKYNNGEATNIGQFMRVTDDRKIAKIDMLEELSDAEKAVSGDLHAIYMPNIVKMGGGYELGDTLDMKIAGETIKYKIIGFFENTFLDTINAYSIGFALDPDEYDFLLETLGEDARGIYVKALTDSSADNAKIAAELTEIIQHYTPNAPFSLTKYWEGIQYSRSFTAQMCSAVFMSLAVIILIISLVVIRFRIQNSIEENMQNIGAMKAMGYTSRQIIGGNVIQFVLVSLVSIVLGTGLSYAVLPLLSNAFAMQTGIIWRQSFDIVSTLVTLAVIIGVTVLCTFVSSHRIKNLNPIVALRGGIVTHSFRRNYLPLDKTRGNINLLLAMKTAIQSIRQNLLIAVIMAATTLCALTSFTMYLKISLSPDYFISTLCGEMPDVTFSVKNPDDMSRAMDMIRGIDGTEKVFEYQSSNYTVDGYTIYTYITNDFSETVSDICYEGRNPAHENEIALNGGFAEKLGKTIGDTITVSHGETKDDFILTGYIQTCNNYGMDSEITADGARLLDGEFKFSQGYAYSEKPAKEVIDEMKSSDIEFAQTLDLRSVIDSQLNTYLSINDIMMITIQAVVLLIILLIFYLVVKTAVIRRRRDLGIQKAVGFTTRQLAMQLVTGFMPTVLVGCAAGGVLSFFLTDSIFSTMFKSLGIMRIKFTPPVSAIVLFCIGISIVTFLISLAVAARIRKVTAYGLIKEV